jgi:hypothetical protein
MAFQLLIDLSLMIVGSSADSSASEPLLPKLCIACPGRVSAIEVMLTCVLTEANITLK